MPVETIRGIKKAETKTLSTTKKNPSFLLSPSFLISPFHPIFLIFLLFLLSFQLSSLPLQNPKGRSVMAKKLVSPVPFSDVGTNSNKNSFNRKTYGQENEDKKNRKYLLFVNQ